MPDYGALPVREDLVGVRSYGAPQLTVAAQLNVNENPYPPSTELIADIARSVSAAAGEMNRYPDRDFPELRRALGEYLDRESGVDVPLERIWAANGSNEVMHQIFLAFGGPGRTALTFDPTYSMYPEYARDTFTRYVTIPRNQEFGIDLNSAIDAIDDYRPNIVLITSPNNPTGTATELVVIDAIAAVSPGVVIVDEAYAEFRRPGTSSALELLSRWPRLIVTRTMSKAFACAGLRLGYAAVADPEVVEALRVVRLPYHLSTVTQAVALTALRHAEELQAQVDTIRAERDRQVTWLKERGLDVAESDANFVMFGRFTDRHAVWQDLLDQGVLIRETGPTGWLRVSIGTPAENEMFRSAITDALSRFDTVAP